MSGQLVICDGDVPGLLGLATAASHRDAGTRFWSPPDPLEGTARARAAAQAAALYQITALDPAPSIGLSDSWESEHRRTAQMQLAAAWAAQDAGLQILWPVTAAETDSLERITQNLDTALLVSRLASLDGPRVEIAAPFADYTDRQLADLVLDMDLPIWTCWWFHPQTLEPRLHTRAAAERDRWTSLLHEAGWRGPLPDAALPAQ